MHINWTCTTQPIPLRSDNIFFWPNQLRVVRTGRRKEQNNCHASMVWKYIHTFMLIDRVRLGTCRMLESLKCPSIEVDWRIRRWWISISKFQHPKKKKLGFYKKEPVTIHLVNLGLLLFIENTCRFFYLLTKLSLPTNDSSSLELTIAIFHASNV